MKFIPKDPPRTFTVGRDNDITLSDCGAVTLAPDEQVTFLTPGGGEYDVARKDWGYYATPSLNARLKSFGLRGALMKNTLSERFFVALVEQDKEDSFRAYCEKEALTVVAWLDDDATLQQLEKALSS